MKNLLIIAEPQPLYNHALKRAVREICQNTLVISVSDFSELRRELRKPNKVDLLILNISLPKMHGYFNLVRLKKEFPQTPILIISEFDDLRIANLSIQCGAVDFIAKAASSEQILKCVKNALEPSSSQQKNHDIEGSTKCSYSEVIERVKLLGPRQIEVLTLILEGLRSKQIASNMKIRECTVKAHITAIFKTLEVYSRTGVVTKLGQLLKALEELHMKERGMTNNMPVACIFSSIPRCHKQRGHVS